MSTSPDFSLHSTEHFERTYKKLKKSFANSGGSDPATLADEVAKVLKALRKDPMSRESGCEEYGLPAKTDLKGWEFWRITFIIPEVKGNARYGRVMYVLNRSAKHVAAFWIYSHAQYAKRPPDKEIRSHIQAIVTSST